MAGRHPRPSAAEGPEADNAPSRRVSACGQAGLIAVPRALNPKSFHANTLPEGYDN
jgi:hypothetical protein